MGKASRLKKERREASSGLTLWHYTTSAHIKQIFESGALKPTAIRIDEGERPALWLSTNPDWEKTVSKKMKLPDGGITKPLQRDELAKFNITPIRIKVNASAIRVVDWKRFKQVSGIRIKTAKMLEEVAREEGANPDEWYATFDPIPLEKWVTIDFFTDGKWVVHDLGEYYQVKQQEMMQQIENAYQERGKTDG